MKRILFVFLFAAAWAAVVNAQTQDGMGTWYETDSKRLTASHAALPLGTRVRVTNPQNGRQVIVTIDNRIENTPDRLIDISKAAADNLGMNPRGTTPVRVEVLSRRVASPAASPPPQPPPPQETMQPEPPPPQETRPQQPEPPPPPETRPPPEPPPPPETRPLPQPPMDRPAPPPVNNEPAAPPAAAPAGQAPANSGIVIQIIIPMNGVPAASGEAVNPAAASADPMPPRPEAGPARVTPRRPDPSSHAIYRVQVGAYLEWKNAEDTSRRLTAAGFSPSFEWYNRYWRVVLTGIRADELEAITRRLEAAGFSQVLYRRER